MSELSQLAEDNDRLRAALREVTGKLAMLLEDGKFPHPRAINPHDKDTVAGWWDDRIAPVQHAYAVLAGASFSEWRNKHPDLYIPPPGLIELSVFA